MSFFLFDPENRWVTGIISEMTRRRQVWARFIFLAVMTFLAAPAAAQFFPPGVVNPFADVDPGEDLFASHVIADDGTMHVVWASSNPYPGIGDSDPDILYSTNSGAGWSAPIAVNSWATTDSDVDERPRLAIAEDGSLHCIWQSQHDFNGAGTDWDIFYRQLDPVSGWGTVEPVNSSATTDNLSAWNNETMPNLAVSGDGAVIALWQYENGTNPGLYWRVRSESNWGNALVYDGPAVGPVALATTAGGKVVAAWEKISPPVNNHFIVAGEFAADGGGGFKGVLVSDTSTENRYPSVASYGKGALLETHYVWASKDDTGGVGIDYDIKHKVTRNGATALGPYVVNSTAATDGSSDDVRPSICVEPGGVLHVAWQSNVDFFSGTDLDTYYSHNGTVGSQWSPIAYLGLNGIFDNPGEDDQDVELRCASNHVLSAMWNSTDDVGGTLGSDRDLFHAIGTRRGYHRPFKAADWAPNDSDFDGRVRLAERGGVVHLIWASDNSGGGLSTGSDRDIYHVAYHDGVFDYQQLVNTSGMLGSDGADDDPDIAVDPNGLLHAVWSSEHDITGNSGTDADIFYAWTDDTGIWSVPELVHASGTSDTADDIGPRIEIDAYGNLHVAWYRMTSTISGQLAYARRSGMGWGLAEIPTVPSATDWNPGSFDLAVEPGGTAHLVWNSWADHVGAGSDTDVFWSRREGGVWTTAELVNDYGETDSSPDDTPRVALAPDGEIYAVWTSTYDAGGAGSDYDLYIAKRDPPGSEKAATGWQPAFLFLDHFGLDSGEDFAPVMVVGEDAIDVAWQSDDGLGLGAAGSDIDIFHASVSRSSSLPSDVGVGLVNANAFADAGDDVGPAIVVDPAGTVFFAWESDDTVGGLLGTDRDVIVGRLGDGGVIFFDDFESGDATEWAATP